MAEFLDQPGNLTFRLPNYDPDFPVYDYSDILDVDEDVPELEALHRWAMVLHNQYPWDRSQVELAEAGQLADDDYVVAFHPRDKEVRAFLRRLSDGRAQPRHAAGPGAATAGAAVPGDRRPAALLRAAAARVAGRGARRPGVQQRRPDPQHRLQLVADERRRDPRPRPASSSAGTARCRVEELALQAAEAALAKAGREPEEIGGVLVCTCTSSRLIPSLATYLCGQLGMQQMYAAYDLIAACAGMPYGVAEAARLLQEVERPVLVVCVEKFSDKIGNVRTSRMIFGDGAAAMVIGPAPDGDAPDIDYLKTYASGPAERGELDPLAQPRVRQQHHGLRAPGEGAGRPLPRADDRGDLGAARTRTAEPAPCWTAST